ncbi:sigma 54-interacting transcriptional regulator [Brevibacillus ginsengisoli]|uniref:sigma 54-interacting transcriptional regulator n=1 Tax=Brevibacillus ginsengisoli TaxID=363854 RepID=UPI003CEFC17A
MRTNPLLLVVDDEENVRRLLAAVLKREGYEVVTAENGQEAVEITKQISPDLVLMDIRMPKMDGITAFKAMREWKRDITVILMTAFASVETAVEAMKTGAYDYIIKPFDNDEVKLLINRALQMERLKSDVATLHRQLNSHYHAQNLLTNTPKMMELYNIVERVAPTNATVLITGESGTGKEVIANQIHYSSKRTTGPFIKINCGALPESLLESELFGHEKGSFTGAVAKKIGRFEMAHEGTLFLDEIGEISPALQVKLLRVLQEREFERVGGTQTIHTDIRIVAATNRNLEAMVREGKFREDLYYRLKVIYLRLPSLRERKEDIRLMADSFLHKYALENAVQIDGFDSAAIKTLEEYHWPGNLRELANVVERAVIMSTGSLIYQEDLLPSLSDTNESAPSEGLVEQGSGQSLKERVKLLEREIIVQALQRNQGNRMKTARELDVSRRTLLYKIEEYGIDD